MNTLLMPKATAVWLIDNTTLTFEQISNFCGLHRLEVQGIADGEVIETSLGADPIAAGELTREEITLCEADPQRSLTRRERSGHDIPDPPKRRKSRYIPIARRNDRPDAIAWLLRHHPDVATQAIVRLIGTTRNMIESVRTQTHWNSANIKPVDPVTLGLCSQVELDAVVSAAAANKARSAPAASQDDGPGLQPLTPPNRQ